MVAGERGSYSPGNCQCERRVRPFPDRDARQALPRLPVVHFRGWPFEQISLLSAPGGQSVGGGVRRVEAERVSEQAKRLFRLLGRLGEGCRQGAQRQLIDVLPSFWLATRSLELGCAHHRYDRTDHALDHLVLELER